MGCQTSKPERHRSVPFHKTSAADLNKGVVQLSTKKTDENIINIMEIEFKDKPEIFILNNIFMSILFVENYHKEFMHLHRITTTRMEKELNSKLLQEHKVSLITPDILVDSVNKNVRFRPHHGNKKEVAEPLIAKRIYVVNDIIETVIGQEEEIEYNSIDKPRYQVAIEDSDHKGFIKLRLMSRVNEKLKDIRSSSASSQRISDHSDPKPGPSTANTENPEDIYQYESITNIQTPKEPIKVEAQRRDTLPSHVFKEKKTKKLNENGYEDNEPTDVQDLYKSLVYIGSTEFMDYVATQKFPNHLGAAMGFTEVKSQVIPGKIFCKFPQDETYGINTEIIPCVEIPWPKQANSFRVRDSRPLVKITNPTNGQETSCRWPSDKMISDIVEFKCVAVAKGYYPKRDKNANVDLEWEIQFPKAEKYLQSRMTYEQHCIYLFLLAIYKTFIEPKSATHGLLVDHIRCHMFWECEKNFLIWPQHRLGTKIVAVLESLKEKLAIGELPDYFIKEKNLFENIPKKYLHCAHDEIYRILETPIMSFIKALRNLRYTSGKFYPTLNFKELHNNLIKDGVDATHGRISIISTVVNTPKKVAISKETAWQLQKEQLIRKKNIEKRNMEKNLKEENRRGSEDSINTKWNYPKNNINNRVKDPLKARLLLKQFTNLYFDIVKKTRQIGSKTQARFYLKQCSYLIALLAKVAETYEMDVRELESRLKNEAIEVEKMPDQKSSVPPLTPARNSVQIFNYDFQQDLKGGNTVNMRNLDNSYLKGNL